MRGAYAKRFSGDAPPAALRFSVVFSFVSFAATCARIRRRGAPPLVYYIRAHVAGSDPN